MINEMRELLPAIDAPCRILREVEPVVHGMVSLGLCLSFLVCSDTGIIGNCLPATKKFLVPFYPNKLGTLE